MTFQDQPKHATFSALYRTHFDAVLAWLLRKAVPGRDAVDVAQFVFIAAWQHMRDIPESDGEARAWLLAVANNQLLNYRRRQINAKLLPEDVVPYLADEQVLEQRLLKAQLIMKTIEGMADGPNRVVFVSIYIDGKTPAKIAAETGASEASVRRSLSRGRAEFRELYEKLHGEKDDLEALDAATVAVIALLLFARGRVWSYVEQVVGIIAGPSAAPHADELGPQTRSPGLPRPGWRRLAKRIAPALVALPLLLPFVPQNVLPAPRPEVAQAIHLGHRAAAAQAILRSEAPDTTTPSPVATSRPSAPSRSSAIPRRMEQHIEDSREAERNMLQQAASLLVRKQPDRALALLREHATKYPGSRLAEQRDSFMRQAMIALGRTASSEDAK